MKNVEQLEMEIIAQGEENVRLYSIFQYRLHEEEMQPLIEKWREGSRHIKELISQKNQLLISERNPNPVVNKQTFVNGYGEATTREITSSTYSRACKRLSKQVMSFIH
ncbi:MAG: hypothetical protein J6C86_07460 [Bacteroidaceae bacterium]|nr:hypothetical protein [Bacteroidaceae bacterium]